jgi:transcription initiation factor IIF auxiliary subunit
LTILEFCQNELKTIEAWYAAMQPGIELNPQRESFWTRVIQLASDIEMNVAREVNKLDRKSNWTVKNCMRLLKEEYGISKLFTDPVIHSVEILHHLCFK